jgi:hypothetical protein
VSCVCLSNPWTGPAGRHHGLGHVGSLQLSHHFQPQNQGFSGCNQHFEFFWNKWALAERERERKREISWDPFLAKFSQRRCKIGTKNCPCCQWISGQRRKAWAQAFSRPGQWADLQPPLTQAKIQMLSSDGRLVPESELATGPCRTHTLGLCMAVVDSADNNPPLIHIMRVILE